MTSMAGFAASINWDSAAGTFLSSSSKPMANDTGGTLQVDVMTLATGTEIPSYNCTTEFQFSDKVSQFTYALNNVSWTCASPPVKTWCMYFC